MQTHNIDWRNIREIRKLNLRVVTQFSVESERRWILYERHRMFWRKPGYRRKRHRPSTGVGAKVSQRIATTRQTGTTPTGTFVVRFGDAQRNIYGGGTTGNSHLRAQNNDIALGFTVVYIRQDSPVPETRAERNRDQLVQQKWSTVVRYSRT